MRVTKVEVQNFGSYRELSFDLSGKGLTLLSGATGSGKSTLCDIVPWILFGVTSKGGSVNDVLAWNKAGPTVGNVTVEVNGQVMYVTRTRNPNDLYFYDVSGGFPTRGKDLLDTQKLLNSALGIDADLYLSGAYFHEFSRLAAFFTSTAKNRRELIEQIVDLSIPVKLQTEAAELASQNKKQMNAMEQTLQLLDYEVKSLNTLAEREKTKHAAWQTHYGQRMRDVLNKRDNFDDHKRIRINAAKASVAKFEREREENIAAMQKSLTESVVCSECGGLIKSDKYKKSVEQRIATTQAQTNPYIETLTHVNEMENTFDAQIIVLENEINPFNPDAIQLKHAEAEEKHEKTKNQQAILQQELRDAEALLDTVGLFRANLVQRVVAEVENATNEFLSRFFDAELKVEFTVHESDKLNVTVWKNGNECSYSQLSKGQRQLLKLSFGVSIMQSISQRHGVHFNALFFDEALDGMDDQFKVKACRLLETLATTHESVFVVEHNAHLRDVVFDRQISVELINGHSVINEQT